MLLRIEHCTDLNYTDLIAESCIELRMAPKQDQEQSRLAFSLAVGPPTLVKSYFDWLGNAVHTFTINPLHRQIKVVAVSVLRTDRHPIDPLTLPDVFPPENPGYRMYDYLAFDGPINDCPELREVAAGIGAVPGMPLGQIAKGIMRKIFTDYEYRTGVTTAASPIRDVLQAKAGVCQDFTHLMVGLSRAVGIPARYVSGLVHSVAAEFRGNAETHAWCELYFPSTGWIGFDPTNDLMADDHFVKVAHGRDYRDVAPNRGVWKGHATESISVSVKSEELKSVPPELAAERMHSLQVPVYPGGIGVQVDGLDQQPPQQQQQQQQQQSLR